MSTVSSEAPEPLTPLENYNKKELSFREQYLRSESYPSEEEVKKIKEAAQEIFNLYLTLTLKEQKEYINEITTEDSFFEYEAEIDFYFILLLNHMLKNDIQFLQKYLSLLRWLAENHSGFVFSFLEYIINTLIKQNKNYVFLEEKRQVLEFEETKEKYYISIIKKYKHKQMKMNLEYFSQRFYSSLSPQKTIKKLKNKKRNKL